MVLKAGQRIDPQPLLLPATQLLEDPTRFVVSAPFADVLEPGDFVRFLAKGELAEPSPLWAKTWRVVRVVEHSEESRAVFVDEVD